LNYILIYIAIFFCVGNPTMVIIRQKHVAMFQ